MTETQAPERITTQQLQARLVAELGEAYRFTTRTITAWASRAENPLPSSRSNTGQRAQYRFDWDEVLEWLEAESDRLEAATPETISSLATGIQVTVRAIARELEADPQTILRRIQTWNIRPVDRRTIQGGAVDYYQLRHILDALTASARTEDPDSLPAIERDAYYRSEMRKDELRKSRRELIEADEARAILAEIVAVRRDFYDLLPDILETEATLLPEALELVQRQIDKARAREAETLLELNARLTPQPVAEAA